MFIVRKLVKIVVSLFLFISTSYYMVGKFILKTNNQFISLVDMLTNFIGKILNFMAQHIIAVLIVGAIATILVLLYKFIVSKNSGDKE